MSDLHIPSTPAPLAQQDPIVKPRADMRQYKPHNTEYHMLQKVRRGIIEEKNTTMHVIMAHAFTLDALSSLNEDDLKSEAAMKRKLDSVLFLNDRLDKFYRLLLTWKMPCAKCKDLCVCGYNVQECYATPFIAVATTDIQYHLRNKMPLDVLRFNLNGDENDTKTIEYARSIILEYMVRAYRRMGGQLHLLRRCDLALYPKLIVRHGQVYYVSDTDMPGIYTLEIIQYPAVGDNIYELCNDGFFNGYSAKRAFVCTVAEYVDGKPQFVCVEDGRSAHGELKGEDTVASSVTEILEAYFQIMKWMQREKVCVLLSFCTQLNKIAVIHIWPKLYRYSLLNATKVRRAAR